MKAVFISEPNKIEVREVPMPKVGQGEALLKIKHVGICGADVASYTGNQPFTTYPRIPGHEFSAEIVEIPENDLGLKKGMIVTANPYFNCGECYSCERGFVNCCTDNQTMGVQRDGTFCEYVAMPIERIYDGMGLNSKELALIEPFTISRHAVSRTNISSNDKVLVIGAGPIGLFALICAKLTGAKVYVADVLDKRLDVALGYGADGVINSAKTKIKEAADSITGENGFDVVIEACGLSQTFLDSIENVCFAGKVILIGNGKKDTTFNHSIILKKELNIFGSRNSYKKDFTDLISIVKQGEIDLMKMVSNIYPIEKADKAFKALANNDGSLAKILVEF
ncbi:zinc-binding alcohol dehydrogenase family protein [Clostridium sp.]|uniref:zinc-binding alcohol dehydrogenase family protein n=1 Tax=Clostridium sp. TaxID=1506 RepID=UPI00284816EF|nr:zinc-binding alcohol dehydrogenase family protein [Clostridium sp.]MDR3593725.1 zinc-binding alcohol dehydrogenase family protein [Clostridium sp.]